MRKEIEEFVEENGVNERENKTLEDVNDERIEKMHEEIEKQFELLDDEKVEEKIEQELG